MADYAVPALYAVLVWWFSTGLIIVLDHLPPRTFRWSMAGATLCLAAAAWGLVATRGDATAAGAYAAFTCGLFAWGWQEMSYYTGTVTGPRTTPCAPTAGPGQRFVQAVATSLWHEAAIVAAAAVIAVVTWNQPNRLGLFVFLVLWTMNVSARLNMFLGVRNLNADFLPDHMRFLGCFFAAKPMNLLFPLSVGFGTVLTTILAQSALAPDATTYEVTAYTFLATLSGLAVLEHWFLVIPLPSERLWKWSLAFQAAFGATDASKSPRYEHRDDRRLRATADITETRAAARAAHEVC